MKISIALATYNGAAYLHEQLESFNGQTYRPDELVITDDGSIDGTSDIVAEFAAIAPFQVIYSKNQINLGYAGNFNAALMKTTGDLVFLSDQDDVWFPEKIERMVAMAESDPEALVLMNDAALTDADLNDTGLTKLGQIRSAGFSEHSFVMGCCAVVRRELLELCLPIPDECKAHDNWIIEIADGLGRKRIYPVVMQYYRRHGKNESQVIVNRTARVTRWHVRAEEWRRRLARLVRRQSSQPVAIRSPFPSQYYMLNWARDAADRVPDRLQADLMRFQACLEVHLQALSRRQEIRTLPLRSRAREAFLHWRRGGYASSSGFKSALRDVVSPSVR